MVSYHARYAVSVGLTSSARPHLPAMNKIGVGEWNIIVCDLRWDDLRLLWMTGNKRLHSILCKCENLVLSYAHCYSHSLDTERKCYNPSMAMDGDCVIKTKPITPGEDAPEHVRMLNFTHLEDKLHLAHYTLSIVPKSARSVYRWVYNTFSKCISHLSLSVDRSCGYLLLAHPHSVPAAVSLLYNPPNHVYTLLPSNDWCMLKSLTISWNAPLNKMQYDVHLPATVTKFTLIRLEVCHADNALRDDGDDAPLSVGRIIAPSLTDLVIMTCDSPTYSHDWIWPSLIHANGDHLINLEWHVTRQPHPYVSVHCRRRIFDLRQSCPILQRFSVLEWTTAIAKTLYFHLPETLTSLSVLDNTLPEICTQQLNVQYLNIIIQTLENEAWISLKEACPNVHTLLGRADGSAGRLSELDRTVLPRLAIVSSELFWALKMFEDDGAFPFVERVMSKSKNGYFHIHLFRNGLHHWTVRDILRTCEKMRHHNKIRLFLNGNLTADDVLPCSQLLSIPSVDDVFVERHMLEDEQVDDDSGDDDPRASILNLPDECIVASQMTMEISSVADLQQCISVVRTKCAPSTLKSLLFTHTGWANTVEMPSIKHFASLPQSLSSFTCHVPVNITDEWLRLVLPCSLTKLELRCGFAESFDQSISKQLERLIACERIWFLSMTSVTGQCCLPDDTQEDCYDRIKRISDFVGEQSNKFDASSSEMQMGKATSKMSLKYTVKRIVTNSARTRLALGWRFGNYGDPRADACFSGASHFRE